MLTWGASTHELEFDLLFTSGEVIQFDARFEFHELRHRLLGGEVTGEYGVHLPGDRHLDVMETGKLDNRGSRRDAFGHHVHLADDVGDEASSPELLADVVVAALRAAARRRQVTVSSEP
jgi:hypothetical protein